MTRSLAEAARVLMERKPFLDWARHSPDGYSVKWPPIIAAIPARHFWDPQWWKAHWAEAIFANPNGNPLLGAFDYGLEHLISQPAYSFDPRPDAAPNDAWWKGTTGECSWFIWAYQSLWLPESLLADDASRQRLANALFVGSRHSGFELHFNKGLAGATPDAIAAAKDTSTNPAVLTAFALAIVGDSEGPAYPGIAGHEPSVDDGRQAAERVERCMNELRAVAPNGGEYVSESNYFEKGFQQSYWGSNYPRLAEIKKKYDPDGCSSSTMEWARSSGALTVSPSSERLGSIACVIKPSFCWCSLGLPLLQTIHAPRVMDGTTGSGSRDDENRLDRDRLL